MEEALIERMVTEFKRRDTQLLRVSKATESHELTDEEMSCIHKRLGMFDKLHENGRLIIPLHKPDSAELSGKSVQYVSSSVRKGYVLNMNGEKTVIEEDDSHKYGIDERVKYWSPFNDVTESLSYEGLESARPDLDVTYPASKKNAFESELLDEVEQEMNGERKDRISIIKNKSIRSFLRQFGGVANTHLLSNSNETFVFETGAETNATQEFGIYPDNEAIVACSISGTKQEQLSMGTITDVRGSRVAVSIETNRDYIRKLSGREQVKFHILPLLNTVPYDRKISAIKSVFADNNVLGSMEPIKHKSIDYSRYDFSGLNESQEEAVAKAIESEPIFCIQGPPGTGKTRTIVNLAKNLVKNDDKRVLVCAHSNQAADNVLVGSSDTDVESHSLSNLYRDDGVSVSRAGNGSQNIVVQTIYEDNPTSTADIVVSTTSSAAEFSRGEFDVAIVDEATQSSIVSTLIPYNCSEKMILVGDHKQLSPYSQGESSKESMFEFLIDKYDSNRISKMLKTQYRMHQDIAHFPSQQFYEGKLKTAERNKNWDIGGLSAISAIDEAGPETRTENNSFKNTAEAKTVQKEVEKILLFGVDKKDIGVISPYSSQVREIRGRLSSAIDNDGLIKVNTVDAFQGSEKELIIVSFVRSNDESQVGFIDNEARLNVSLTRAKKRLVLIGDWDTLISGSELYKELYEYLCQYANLERINNLRVKKR
jgi:DNA polymerase III delta prime subunit